MDTAIIGCKSKVYVNNLKKCIDCEYTFGSDACLKFRADNQRKPIVKE